MGETLNVSHAFVLQAHITHPELKCTFNLEIIGVKKNPNGPMYTQMGVLTKGTIIEVRRSACSSAPTCCCTVSEGPG